MQRASIKPLITLPQELITAFSQQGLQRLRQKARPFRSFSQTYRFRYGQSTLLGPHPHSCQHQRDPSTPVLPDRLRYILRSTHRLHFKRNDPKSRCTTWQPRAGLQLPNGSYNNTRRLVISSIRLPLLFLVTMLKQMFFPGISSISFHQITPSHALSDPQQAPSSPLVP